MIFVALFLCVAIPALAVWLVWLSADAPEDEQDSATYGDWPFVLIENPPLHAPTYPQAGVRDHG